MAAKDFWAFSSRNLRDRWPRDAYGRHEQAARLVHQSELDGMSDLTISLL